MATDEITKGNQIIKKLQDDAKSLKSKLKLKNMVAAQQEKLLDERANNSENMQKDVFDLKDLVAKRDQELKEAAEKIEELNKKVEEGKAIVEDNNHGNYSFNPSD